MRELKRKLVHFTGLVVPAIYVYFGRDFAISFLVVVLAIFSLFEPIRLDAKLREEIKRGIKLYVRIEDFERVIEEITRSHERSRIGAHIYFVVGALIVVWFTPDFAVGIVTVAVVSDALASLIGRFGRFRFRGKSLEGFLAYFVSAVLVLSHFNCPHPFVLSLVGALVELMGVPPDDNFSCQVAMCVTATLLKLLT